MVDDGVKYSVVVPVFNSDCLLIELFGLIKKTMDNLSERYEVIFVDDGSKDSSWEQICNIKDSNPAIFHGIRLSRNFGQHNATFCGLNFSSGEIIITIDDDLQVLPEDIALLIEIFRKENADVVYGYFPDKKHSNLRNAGSKSIQKSTKLFTRAPGKGSSFRLLTRSLVDKMIKHHQNSVYIDELVLWHTARICFAEVTHHKSRLQKSRYTWFKLFKLYLKIFFYSTDVPLKLLVYGGFITSVISFLLGMRFIIRKIFFNVPLGYTSIIVSIFFSTSLILISLGVIGEYLRRVYENQNKKMPYLIKQMTS